ncbi:MAG: hypothetical protein HKM89_08930 [Gemmatimonadales bacterium]|nr:hypothetical protein [Gemmatimonadales bacterium]
MLSLLAVLLTFVGAMLVLALAAESLQELIKVVFAFKGQARVKALSGLVVEAARSKGLTTEDGEAIFTKLRERLQALGQDGVRNTALRLDRLDAKQLSELITKVNPDDVVGLTSLDAEEAAKYLNCIAGQATQWFPLAMTPVTDRYGRRMRFFALLPSAIVVLALNADALSIFNQARTDESFRESVGAAVATLDSLDQVARRLSAAASSSIQEQPAPAAVPQDATAPEADASDQEPGTEDASSQETDEASVPQVASQDSLQAVRDSIRVLALSIARSEQGFLIGNPGGQNLDDLKWWAGILVSILLVSLGSPFWHDALRALFGAKQRITAQAQNLRTGSLPAPEVGAAETVAAPKTPSSTSLALQLRDQVKALAEIEDERDLD